MRRCERLDCKEEIHCSLQVIEEQAKKIEIVIKALINRPIIVFT